jgi:hypothetical protein
LSVTAQSPVTSLTSQLIRLEGNKSFTLKVLQGYTIKPAVEGLKRPRFFAKSPDGRLFVTDLYDKTDNKKGKIYILDDWNEQTKTFMQVITYLQDLHNPNQVAFYTVNGQHYLYVAETGKLSFRMPGDTAIAPAKQIATFRIMLSYKYGLASDPAILLSNNKLCKYWQQL